ncbi:MAG: hypothetical protein IT366_24000 [Candidatus Hydrogenedentes bacterium]|nr:hypothetical protein [Candidatus Hydrogenedentota bacterium]
MPDTRYFAVLPAGASGVRIAQFENGRFQFDGEAHSFECSVDEFYQAMREEYDRVTVYECTETVRDASRRMRCADA